MREVLSFEYDAAADSLTATISTVRESEHVPGVMVRQLGVPEPKARVLIDELPPVHATAFRALRAALVPIIDAKHAAAIADPAALAAKAAQVASAEQLLKSQQEAARHELAVAATEKRAKLEELAALEAANARKAAALAELDAQIAAKQAALAAIVIPTPVAPEGG